MKLLINNLKIFLFLIVLTGIVYPLLITIFSQSAFRDEANGSLLTKNGRVIGSELLAQEFKGRQYFWPRPSSSNYDASSSAASNLSPDSKILRETIAKRAADNGLDINSNDDLLYASGSGLDPHISLLSAERQLERIADARHLNAERKQELKQLLTTQIEGRKFGLLGRERINVLKLNLLLDEKF